MSASKSSSSLRHAIGGAAILVALALFALAPATALGTTAEFKTDTEGIVSSDAVFKADTQGGVEVNASASTLQTIEFDVGALECETFTGSGTSGNSAQEVSLGEVTYGDCVAVGLEAEVLPNGCEYTLHAGTYESGDSSGSMELDCPAGKKLEIDASGLCTVRIPPQSFQPVAFETAAGEPQGVREDLNATSMEYSYEGFCGKGENANGVYVGEIALSAVTNDKNKKAVGLSVAAKPIGDPRINVAGDGLFSMEFGELECADMTASGLAEGGGQSPAFLTEYVRYDDCPFFGLQAEVYFNCNYIFNAGTLVEAGKSVGSMDIVCPGSEVVEIGFSGLCEVEIPGQIELSDVTFTNEEVNDDIVADFDVDWISYSYKGFFCGTGYPDDGSYSGKATFSAVTDDESKTPVGLSIVG